MAAHIRLISFTFCPLAVVACVSGRAGNADPKGSPPDVPAIYADKADHLWNRLHGTLLVRTGPDGKNYGADRLEPLLWKDSVHLLQGESAERAVAVLEEFERESGEKLIDDPMKRAILQRDLWLVSSWLSAKPDSEARWRLEKTLDNVIRRLALTPPQIAKLPDNYAQAVTSKKYADRFDPQNPEQAYLPADLFDGAGPWVCVGPANGPSAPFHLDDRGTNPFANSVFFVFLKLPGGREKTLDFLKQLASLDNPLVPNTDETTKHAASFLPQTNFPVWPKGTEVALVRRALLIDVNRRIAASPLTEGVQIRVVTTDTPALTKDVLAKASSRRPPSGWQASFEFQLRRIDLFADTAGGLRDVSGERDFKTGFNSHPWDEFDQTSREGTFPERSMPFETNRASCTVCHNYPGAYSFNSVPGFAFGGFVPVNDSSPQKPLGPTTVAAVEKQAIEWKEERPAWTAFVKRSGQ
ncbi:MAG TPA: hypothetical protein VKU82_13145 [Planctomycetaceae bacterium]|nr:hypothetical protein [Planctomycetaceae bacterium]